MPTSELCSACYLGRLQMMQASPYSLFNSYPWYQTALRSAVSRCSYQGPTSTQPALIPVVTPSPLCLSGKNYVVQSGDTCDSIGLANSVSSASIFFGNKLPNCTILVVGQTLCLPLTCKTYQLNLNDDCVSASVSAGVANIAFYNTWINSGCDNLHIANLTMGSVLCASPTGGIYSPGTPTNTSTFPGSEFTGYGTSLVAPPAGVTVAKGSLLSCGGWWTVAAGDTCGNITLNSGVSLDLFALANPSINEDNCTTSLIVGDAYCVAPLRPGFNDSAGTWTSFGCWTNPDPSSAVLLDDRYNDTISMTVDSCAQYCMQRDWAFFGLSDSDECSCGTEISINSVQVSASQCNMVCAGNSSETCGGSVGMSLYGPPGSLAFQYSDLGCYSDNSTIGHTLSGTSLLGQSNNSVAACASFCLPTYTYFGVEQGSDCWCGNSIAAQATILPTSSCNTNCTGDKLDPCGGVSAIEVYGVKTVFNISSTASSTLGSSTSRSASPSTSTTTSPSVIIVSSASSTQSATPTSPPYYSWGCYTEGTNVRALGEASLVNYTSMTVEICANFCLVQQSQIFFGLEYGGEVNIYSTLSRK